MKLFSDFGGGRLARGFWPKGKVISALKNRYHALEDLGEEDGLRLLGVSDGEVRFVVALILIDGNAEQVAEIGFLARFSGFALSNAQLDAVNRNLHISVATFHNDGDLYLLGGVAAAGDFNEGMFGLVLEAWKRDVLVVLNGISSASFVDAFPVARSEAALRFAINRAKGDPADLFRSFSRSARLAVCPNCSGRGKIGFIARSCGSCGGAGFTDRKRS
jgi:hypothetical protein